MPAGLFGLVHSNRDFSKPDSWGKNQFNSSFPAALLCYLQYKGIPNVYLKYEKGTGVVQKTIETNDVFGIKWDAPSIFFGFEQEHQPYSEVLVGKKYPIDLSLQNTATNKYIRALEIKLTAIPDSTTFSLDPSKYGAELVIRTPTIAYISSSLALFFKGRRHILRGLMGTTLDGVQDWTKAHEVLLMLPKMVEILQKIADETAANQTPLIVQPIWKTKGKSAVLDENCLDSFVWSDLAFLSMLLDRVGAVEKTAQAVTRPIRTIIWLFKMLYDFNRDGHFNAGVIMDQLSYGPKNDKALSLSGNVTNRYLQSEQLNKPRITKLEIKKIIQGNGAQFLSPERRFDASIVNDPELYAND